MRAVKPCLVLVLLPWLVACGPVTESERAYFEAQEAEVLEREELAMKLVESAKDEDVVRLVAEKTAPDGRGTTKDWIEVRAAQAGGQVLFPKWEVLRRGSNKYEVQYTYTIIDAENKLAKQGWAWNVDMMLRLVSAPRDLETVSVSSRPSSSDASEREARRIQEEEASLE